MCRTANSQDLNILNIELFSVLQSLRYKKLLKSLDDLYTQLKNHFEEFLVVKSNCIFLKNYERKRF